MNDSLIGSRTHLEATLPQEDVLAFGRLSRDDHPIHVDDAFARGAGLAGCIVQGSYFVGLMAGASTKMFVELGRPVLSYGYDRLRFTGQLAVGGTAVVDYVITEEDKASRKVWADVTVKAADGRLLAVARHIAKLL
jgi:3-hydroxybutyryl-CoA dehydratase